MRFPSLTSLALLLLVVTMPPGLASNVSPLPQGVWEGWLSKPKKGLPGR